MSLPISCSLDPSILVASSPGIFIAILWRSAVSVGASYSCEEEGMEAHLNELRFWAV